MEIFFISFIPKTLKNSKKLCLKLVCKNQKCFYICNQFIENGEILKRPTRADCKSAVKTSQVRILLSPRMKVYKKSIIFIDFFLCQL